MECVKLIDGVKVKEVSETQNTGKCEARTCNVIMVPQAEWSSEKLKQWLAVWGWR